MRWLIGNGSAVAICVLWVVACTSFGAGAGASAADAGPRDASEDENADAGAPSDSATASPCATTHAFCDDFDRTGALLGSWSKANIDSSIGASLMLSTDRAVTGFGSLRARLPRRSSGPSRYVTLRKDIPSVLWGRMRLDLDAYLVTPDWQPGDLNSGILCMGFDSEQLSADACLTVNAGQTDFSGTAGPLLPLDRWVHIAIDFDTQGTTTFKVGDAAPVVRPRPTNKPTGNTYAYLEIGVVGSDAPSPNIDAMFDNVVVDLP